MIRGFQRSNLLSELHRKMAKHESTTGRTSNPFTKKLNTGGVTFKKGVTTDRTKAPEVQASEKRFTQNEGA